MKTSDLCWAQFVVLTLAINVNTVSAADILFQETLDSELPETTRIASTEQAIAGLWSYQINANALRGDTRRLVLSLKPGLTVTALVKEVNATADGGLLWQGEIERSIANPGKHLAEIDALPTANYAILARRGTQISGAVVVDGHMYSIQPLNGNRHAVIRADNGSMFEDQDKLNSLSANTAPLPQPKLDVIIPPIYLFPLPKIRVLVAYTAAAATTAGNIPNLVDIAVAQTNQSFSNSRVGASIELAGVVKVNYTESNSVFTDLLRLTGTSDGNMDEIHGMRSGSRLADVVVLITNTTDDEGGIAKIGADADTAFAVVGASVATSKYAFSHEIGHLLGARHDTNWDPLTTPYVYGHGYVAGDFSFRTIMAYECDYVNCPVVNYWSNPDISYGGRSMGLAGTANVARVINQTASYVSSFRGGNINPGLLEWEYNNQWFYGNPVQHLTSIMRGAIGDSNDTDYFAVYVPAGVTLWSLLSPGANSDLDLYIYDKDGTTLLASSAAGTGQQDSASVKNYGTKTEVRFVRVKYYSGATGSTNGKYTLRLSSI